MPPKDSVIRSPATRSAVIAGLMLSLLAGSLALSWGLTGAPLRPPAVPTGQQIALSGAALTLPGNWRLESAVAEEGSPFLQWTFANQVSPAELLRVVRFTATQETDPDLVMGKFVLPQLIAGRRVIINNNDAWIRKLTPDSDTGELTDLMFSTQRLAGMTSPQLHAVRLLTPDRKNFWVFQLTDQVPAEHWNRGLEESHLEQLQRMLTGLAYEPGDAAE